MLRLDKKTHFLRILAISILLILAKKKLIVAYSFTNRFKNGMTLPTAKIINYTLKTYQQLKL
jgi:hypothetical protein